MSRYKLIALFGYSGAGKDTLLNYVLEKHPNEFHKIISYTTRPMRENEKEGREYHFISVQEFTDKVLNGSMLEATQWGSDFYGTDISTFDENKINIGILDENGIQCLIDNPDIQVYPIFITANGKTRLLRALNREKNPDCIKICNRFLEDDKRFNKELDFNFEIYYNYDNRKPFEFIEKIAEMNILTFSI